jgi:hypothetical protein
MGGFFFVASLPVRESIPVEAGQYGLPSVGGLQRVITRSLASNIPAIFQKFTRWRQKRTFCQRVRGIDYVKLSG